MFKKIKVKILSDRINIPKKATKGSACFDLQADIKTEITINPGDIVKIPTGIAVSTPNKKYAAFVFGRSGLGINHGITLSNAVGVVDSDYTGEVCVGLCNVSKKPYVVKPFERIAQLCVIPVFSQGITICENLKQTERADKGFGSSGR